MWNCNCKFNCSSILEVNKVDHAQCSSPKVSAGKSEDSWGFLEWDRVRENVCVHGFVCVSFCVSVSLGLCLCLTTCDVSL